jgi:hypothetical protein
MGKILASIIALLGICLVAVPTAIISSGFIEQIQLRSRKKTDTPDFLYCPHCGKRIQNHKNSLHSHASHHQKQWVFCSDSIDALRVENAKKLLIYLLK